MDPFAGSAQGAVDSLLGVLVSVVLDEARLLGNVRGDVEFIKDEMESMNGFLLHVGDGLEDDDHQVRAWMKQIRDVAIESERWVEQYQRWAGKAPYGRGLVGYLRRIPHSMFTISERHEIATKIHDLKTRAKEVGERRVRYGVEVPPKKDRLLQGLVAAGGGDDGSEEEQYNRRRSIEGTLEVDITEDDIGFLTKWLRMQRADIPSLRVIRAVRIGKEGKEIIKSEVLRVRYFQCICWITVPEESSDSPEDILKLLLSDLLRPYGDRYHGEPQVGDVEETLQKVYELLKTDRFFIAFDGIDKDSTLVVLLEYLGLNCTPGSAILVYAKDHTLFQYSYYRSLDKVADTVDIYVNRAAALVQDPQKGDKQIVLKRIMTKLAADFFSSDILLRLLFTEPHRAFNQLESLDHSLQYGAGWDSTLKMLLFCYNDLQPVYRTCLLYLCIYPEGVKIRRTCLVRRWLAEGLVPRRAGLSSADAAERCVNALLDHGFLRCYEQSAAGKAKHIMVPDPVFKFIMQTARAENYTDMNIPPDLAHHLSVGSGIQLQQVPTEQRRHLCSLICSCIHGIPASQSETDLSWKNTIELLKSLPTIERQGLLKVLDLEFCESHLLPKYVKNICRVSGLRYLNLRRTLVTELPKDINKLQNLETLDIRGTGVNVLPANIVYLQKLKHLLAGRRSTKYELNTDVNSASVTLVESFSTVDMPNGVGNMMGMQIMSHVKVLCNEDGSLKEYDDLGRLQKVRKLGLVIKGGGHSQFSYVMHVVEKLDRCLRSLSIQWEPREDENSHHGHGPRERAEMITLPVHLQSLRISGFRGGMPDWALKPNQLVKVTLEHTSLKNNDIRTLGLLASLCFLRLHFVNLCHDNSEENHKLVLEQDEFKILKFLLLEKMNITSLSFEGGATPKLEQMAWSYSKVNALLGINRPMRLGVIDFTGSRVIKEVTDDIAKCPRSIRVIRSRQGSELAAEA